MQGEKLEKKMMKKKARGERNTVVECRWSNSGFGYGEQRGEGSGGGAG